VRKAIIFALTAVIIVVIFLSINLVSENEDFDKSIEEEEQTEELPVEPQGRNLSVQLDEKMGFSTP